MSLYLTLLEPRFFTLQGSKAVTDEGDTHHDSVSAFANKILLFFALRLCHHRLAYTLRMPHEWHLMQK